MKRQQVNLPDSIKSALVKRAASEGKSASELAREWIEERINSPSGTVPGSDPVEAFKKAVRELKKEGEGEEDYRVILADLGLESLKTTPGPDGLSPSIVRYLVETQARIDFLLRKVVDFGDMPGVTPGERQDWVKVSELNAREALKNLKLGGVK
ncbi:MAG: hypothetical protein M1537_01865 [Nitrospirae bacterium]|nr:hypothetical protein [Nitrospirota bacterium]MCL5284215.1 hypothetical protein [Nitrospirota bacterium]